jgi:radical SAM superfamily enzyme YgiQ (UPF0313 family)
MRIAALNPPFLPNYSRGQRSPAVTRSGTLYFPIWISYAVGALEQAGHQVLFLDAPAAGLSSEEVIEKVEAFSPRMAVLETSTPSIESDVELADRLSESVPTVMLVGTHPSAMPESTVLMGERFTGVVMGEYERPLLGVAAAIEEGKDLREVAGLCLREVSTAVSTGVSPPLEDLDSLPFVSEVYDRHLRVEDYSNPNALHPQVMIMGGRGCPYRCSFCVFPQTLHGRSLRKRSVDDVVREMLWVERNLPRVRAVFFEDDTISVDRERLRKLAGAILSSGVSLSWTANMRADVDFETLRLCREAGLRTVCVGYESGDDEILLAMRKGIDTGTMLRFARDARKAGVLVHGCFMVGLPGETRRTMQKTLEFALRLDPDTAQFYPLMVYPGTDAYEEARQSGRITAGSWREWLREDGTHNCVIRTEELTGDELVRFCNYARRKFYLRPSYMAGKLWRVIRDRDERHTLLKALGTFWKHLLTDEG